MNKKLPFVQFYYTVFHNKPYHALFLLVCTKKTHPVQVNGKVRGRVVVPADASEDQIKSAALASEAVQKYLEGKTPKKVIVAQKKLVNIVV